MSDAKERFDLEQLHPNFRKGVKVMRTPGGVRFAAPFSDYDFENSRSTSNLMWISTDAPVQITSTYDEYGNPVIRFADVVLWPWGEDGSEGNLGLDFPDGTVEA